MNFKSRITKLITINNPYILNISTSKSLNLGCGSKSFYNAFGIDLYVFNKRYVDIISNLEKPLPIKSNTIQVIYSDQVLEHINDLVQLINEIHRVLKDGGIFVATVPHYKSHWAYLDPTHLRFFTADTLSYFELKNQLNEDYPLSNFKFKKIIKILDVGEIKTPIRILANLIVNKGNFRFENSLLKLIYSPQSITFIGIK